MESKQKSEIFACPSSFSSNRTSMESKHSELIEMARAEAELLIEPVWNRNCPTHFFLIRFLSSNRTSMESKLIMLSNSFSKFETSNRTSMESKLLIRFQRLRRNAFF